MMYDNSNYVYDSNQSFHAISDIHFQYWNFFYLGIDSSSPDPSITSSESTSLKLRKNRSDNESESVEATQNKILQNSPSLHGQLQRKPLRAYERACHNNSLEGHCPTCTCNTRGHKMVVGKKFRIHKCKQLL